MPKIRILIADDHAMLREGIRALLTLHKDIEVVGESSDGKEAVEKAEELKPDVVILDIAMPGMDGLEAARRIKKKNPEIKILILTQHDNKEYILSAIKAGMAGYVPKRALASELVSAIHAIYEGNPFLYPSAASALIEDYREHVNEEADDKLTGRQREILKLIAEGHTQGDRPDAEYQPEDGPGPQGQDHGKTGDSQPDRIDQIRDAQGFNRDR